MISILSFEFGYVILRRHPGGDDRSLTGGVGIEARLIVKHADLDATVEGGLAESSPPAAPS